MVQPGGSCAWGPRELGEAETVLSWSFQRERSPANTQILDFWLPNSERIHC